MIKKITLSLKHWLGYSMQYQRVCWNACAMKYNELNRRIKGLQAKKAFETTQGT